LPGRPVCSVVNKIDLAPGRRPLGADNADLGDVLYSSALTGEGVGELFATLGDAIVRRGL
jgi:50S ribosomal subunit-associated GTPase HflX